MTRISAKRAFKLAAITTVSLAALTGAGQAMADGSVTPSYGNIRPFYGNIRPFYGNIRPFYGNIRPFYGNIRPFWGNIRPFWGDSNPFISATDAQSVAFFGPTKSDAFWGSGNSNPYTHNPNSNVAFSQIAGFWNTEAASWDQVQSLWAGAGSSADYASVASQLQTLILNPAGSFWGAAAEKATKTKTFGDAVSNNLLSSAGITFNNDGSINASSLANLDETDQQMLFLNLYDTLMSFSGTGHVDWWMQPTGWSPALAQAEGKLGGGGDQPVSIGMLDFTMTPTITSSGKEGPGKKDAKGTVLQYGSNVFGDGHGAAVGSLIMSPTDGSNIMGVLPTGDATITVYDPYDSTGSTNWTDVGKGIDTLTQNYFRKGDGKAAPVSDLLKPVGGLLGSLGLGGLWDTLDVTLGGVTKIAPAGSNLGVINASLGEAGWTLSPGWNGALASGSAKYSILVVAAGNDGVAQPADVSWNFAKNPTLLVVGSVGVDGTISNFSNTPGNACLTDASTGACDPLKNHFLVAPGELILVSDGSGGINRQTGTSLAAPLVTGAIGLLEARWPWLSNYPNETASIILQSATRIHSPGNWGSGPDPVYGWGELNIAASQSPLDWRSLAYYRPGALGTNTRTSLSDVVSTVRTGNQTSWNSSKLYFTALERIGDTYRDFQVPLASSLVGQNVSTLAGQQMFQSYLTGELKTWVGGGAHFASAKGYDPATASFMASSQQIGDFGDSQLRMRMGVSKATYGFSEHTLPVSMDFALVGPTHTMQFGFGDGAAALSGQPGLTGGADFQLGRGGANPLLGLASGGAYANWRMSVIKNLTISFGATDRRSVRDTYMLGALGYAGAKDLPGQVYAANAENFGLDYQAGKHVTLHASLTRLREDSGLLGIQSLQPGALGDGSSTRAASFGADFDLKGGFMLSGSATVANTTAGSAQSLATAPGGLTSTAAEIAVTKAGLFSGRDRVRLTLSKPMQVVSGQLQYANFGVIDRQTGELGQIVESASAAGDKTPFAAELFYGRLMKNDAEASVFMRAGMNTDQFGLGPRNDYMVGYRYKMAF